MRPHRPGPHRRRPGGDHALPAGALRRAGGVRRHEAVRSAVGPAAARLPAGGDRGLLPGARSGVRRTTGATPTRAMPAPAIREQVLPAWEAALPGAVEAACRAAEVAAEMEELVAAVLAEAAAGAGPLAERRRTFAAARDGRLERRRPARPGAGGAETGCCTQWLEGRARPAASRAGVLAVEALLSDERVGRAGAGRRVARLQGVRPAVPGAAACRDRAPAPARARPVRCRCPDSAEWGDLVVRGRASWSGTPRPTSRARPTWTRTVLTGLWGAGAEDGRPSSASRRPGDAQAAGRAGRPAGAGRASGPAGPSWCAANASCGCVVWCWPRKVE